MTRPTSVAAMMAQVALAPTPESHNGRQDSWQTHHNSGTYTWNDLVRTIAGDEFAKENKVAGLLSKKTNRIMDHSLQGFILHNLSMSFHASENNIVRVICFLSEVTNLLRDRPRIHLSNLIAELIARDVVRDRGPGLPGSDHIKKILFIAIGWITHLFVPDVTKIDQSFAVDTEGAVCFEVSSVPDDDDNRPIIEIVRELGDILPTCPNTDNSPTADILHVASLNIATLIRVGNVQIHWTESISSHLDFDTAHLDPQTGTIVPVLKLFRYPSFCYQHSLPTSVLHELLGDWYDPTTKPARFTTKALMQEILLSYKLLVLFDRKARKLFKHITKDIAKLSDYDDELDKLCLGYSHDRPEPFSWHEPRGLRETFRASSDFPIFSSRLIKVEQFIDSIQPNTITALWKDRRDILRWYTFWAIFVLGSINLAVALVQTSLAAEQVRLAKLTLLPTMKQS
ncbi:hypothetical protein F5Y07DRAFT_26488 [Xylaria sp. FL0933]|nr:hypothetical protein F5Y07DRAFT_26488 [Xylaria sp. FL0933]